MRVAGCVNLASLVNLSSKNDLALAYYNKLTWITV